MKTPDLLPIPDTLNDEELRLRDALNSQCGKLLATLDAAMKLRTAPGEAAKARHLARADLQSFANHAMLAMFLRREPEEMPHSQGSAHEG